jgi:membrane dipeptidase
MRMLTLVHYTDNTLGDIMSGPDGARGLTDFGRDVVAAMNRTGLMIDLSHASEKTTLDALAITKKPAVITHTHINSAALSNPRFISEEVAHAVAETGGYIGAWPAGLGMTTLAEFIDRIDFLVDTVGEDHVVLGSDMDANYRPVLETYRKMPLVVGALMKRGYSEARLAKFLGGNILRVMDDVQAV